MKSALKWLLPVLILAEVALVWSGLLDVGDAVLVLAGIEILIVLTGIGGIILFARRYRRGRSAGLDLWAALEDGLAVLLPRRVTRFVLHEPRLLAALLRWTFLRVTPADNEFGYHKRSILRAILPLVIVTSPVELLVVHLLACFAALLFRPLLALVDLTYSGLSSAHFLLRAITSSRSRS